MDDTTILGGTLNQLGQTAKKTGQQMAKIPEEMAKDAGNQIGVSAKQNADGEKSINNKSQWQSDEERIKFLKDLYGSKSSSEESLEKSTSFVQASTVKPEEQKKLIELRNQLHKENYYDPLIKPVKKQEERPAEKVEQEKKQGMMELQKKEERAQPPLAVVREQNKAEMFRGVAG